MPPVRHSPVLGIHPPRFCPLGASECTTIRSPIRAPLRGRTLRILDEWMRQLRPHRQRPDRTEPGGKGGIPGQQSLPGNRQDLGGVPGVRCGSHQAIEARRRRCARQHGVADDGGGKGQGQDRITAPVAPIIEGGYNLGMLSVRLTIIVRLDQAALLGRLVEFVEERRTLIGTDVSVLLSAADGPGAAKLFTDLGALAIPFEATVAIGTTHYLVADDGNQTGGGAPIVGRTGERQR